MKKIKVKYDKQLEKYHIEYDRLKDKDQFRYNYLKSINDKYTMVIFIQTHLGSINKPEPRTYIQHIESVLHSLNIGYSVKPIEIRPEKTLFGLVPSNKMIRDFSIAFPMEQGILNVEIFERLLNEFDLQIGYDLKKNLDSIFTDIDKGYFDLAHTEDYYGQTLFDSKLFSKFLGTENLTPLLR